MWTIGDTIFWIFLSTLLFVGIKAIDRDHEVKAAHELRIATCEVKGGTLVKVQGTAKPWFLCVKSFHELIEFEGLN